MLSFEHDNLNSSNANFVVVFSNDYITLWGSRKTTKWKSYFSKNLLISGKLFYNCFARRLTFFLSWCIVNREMTFIHKKTCLYLSTDLCECTLILLHYLLWKYIFFYISNAFTPMGVKDMDRGRLLSTWIKEKKTWVWFFSGIQCGEMKFVNFSPELMHP